MPVHRELVYTVAALLIVGFVVPAAQATVTVVGRTPGAFSVTPSGSATYTIPINVPAGINGLRPSVAMVYDSQAGDGIAGMGWTLAGFSSISRCAKTIATNGARQGVLFDSSDQFCLDGQPLVRDAANSGGAVYGANGTMYRTEIDNYVRVISFGSTNGGPTYFQAKHPNGLTYYYAETSGTVTNSRVPAGGVFGNPTRVWKIVQIQDRVNNSIRFTYKGLAEDFNPATIIWTDHCAAAGCSTGSGAMYNLSFNYEARPPSHQRSGYIAGYSWTQTTRLKEIVYSAGAASGGTIIQTYTLSYTDDDTDPSNNPPADGTQRSQLSSVSQCSNPYVDTQCFTATSFTWTNGRAGWDSPMGTAVNEDAVVATFGDFDGDGRTDMLAFDPATSSAFEWYRATGDYENPWDPQTTNIGDAHSVADFNGDGRDDVVATSAGNVIVQISDGTGNFSQPQQTGISAANSATPLDFNGDGLADLAYVQNDNVYLATNTGSGFATPVQATLSVQGSLPSGRTLPPKDRSLRSADFDGDGRQDLLVHYHASGANDRWAAFTHGTATGDDQWVAIGLTPSSTSATHVVVLDINGDGLSDLAYYQANATPGWYTQLSQGTALSTPQFASAESGNPAPRAIAADYNGDGRDDLLIHPNKVHVSIGNSLSNIAVAGPDFGAGDSHFVAIDVDGDGMQDLISPKSNAGSQSMSVARHLKPLPEPVWPELSTPRPGGDLVTSITDGLDNSVSAISYKPIIEVGTDFAYTATTGADSPNPALPALYNHLVRGSSFQVVHRFTADDGAGGSYTQNYHYTNMWMNSQGRGLLGFRRVEQSGGPSGAFQTATVFRQDFPFTGRPVEQAVCQQPGTCSITSGTRVTTSTTIWTELSPAPHFGSDAAYHAVRESQTSGTEYEVNGSTVRRTTVRDLTDSTDWDYTLGAPKQEQVTVQGGGATWTRTRDYTYGDAALAASWCLGLPTRIDESRTNSGGSATRSVFFTYTPWCDVLMQRVGPDGSYRQLKTVFQYNAYGNIELRSEISGIFPSPSPDTGQPAVQRSTAYSYGDDAWAQYYPRNETRIIQAALYDECGNLLIPEIALETAYTWNGGVGGKASETTPQNVVANWSYDNFGRPTDVNQTTRGLNSHITYTECTSGSVCFTPNAAYRVSTERTDGLYTDAFFDSFGRQVGQATVLINGKESRQATRFNALGQVSEQDVPYVASVGQASSAINFVSFDYDNLGRIETETRPTGSNIIPSGTIQTVYSYSGLTTTVTDAELRVRELEYNADGTLKEVREDPGGIIATTSYEYTPFGELKKITDAGDAAGRHESNFEYDVRGFLSSRSDNDRGTWTFYYDAWGDLELQIHPEGRQEFKYDNLARLVVRTDKSNLNTELTTTWAYYGDEGGRSGLLKEVTTGAYHKQSFTYYTSGASTGLVQQIKTSLPQNYPGMTFDTDYSYDSLGRVQSMLYPAAGSAGRFEARYQYSSATGYPEKVCQGSGGGCLNDIYTVGDLEGSSTPMDALGRITHGYFGSQNDGPRETYEYDWANLQLSKIETTISGPSSNGLLQNYQYFWDKVGNLKRRNRLGIAAPENFNYDALNRLDFVTRGPSGPPTMDLSYYPNGNISTKETAGIASTYSYGTTGGGPHAVSNVTGGSASGTFHYDEEGRLDCRAWNSGSSPPACASGSTTTWTSFNLPQRIEYGGTDTYADFAYGPNRERVRTTEHEGTITSTTLVVGPHFEVAVYDNGDPWISYRSYVLFGDRKVYARVDRDAGGLEEGYLHTDHQGSLDRITNIGGSISADTSFSFDAFGKRRNLDWTDDTDDSLYGDNQWLERGYTDHQHLDGVRLIHMNGRVQNPAWGRMLSPDPLVGDLTSPQSLNPYSYVANNPVSLVDPTGYGSITVTPCDGLCEVVVTVTRDDGKTGSISLMGTEVQMTQRGAGMSSRAGGMVSGDWNGFVQDFAYAGEAAGNAWSALYPNLPVEQPRAIAERVDASTARAGQTMDTILVLARSAATGAIAFDTAGNLVDQTQVRCSGQGFSGQWIDGHSVYHAASFSLVA